MDSTLTTSKSECGLTECQGKEMCRRCVAMKTHDRGFPSNENESTLRRMLAESIGLKNSYFKDGEAHGVEHGVVIDFMRDPIQDLQSKIKALKVARSLVENPMTLNTTSETGSCSTCGVKGWHQCQKR